ncbi:phytanoyl-CoA dioxygenase family protein [Pseudoalteromonas sp. JBTF-M23]|uniref:Phytanoyl-CoA dioxygenase family protein n=1 Tax=Pseudoalteromonas caenipelagi TaxID=2726988 RepID=A0A849VAQ2_9GAMM|nr:phytanoyl-CoA dioxygenase family protein [Pseudoalteromonas caenipelagi]NOU50719.1 phytanoyl-CoA dioxygenase family protein [Pseudoalteromonas caenipelagi]
MKVCHSAQALSYGNGANLELLEAIWQRVTASIIGNQEQTGDFISDADKAVFDLIGLSWQHAISTLYQYAHSYKDFLKHILPYSNINELAMARATAYVSGHAQPQEALQLFEEIKGMDNVLDDFQMQQWRMDGYVVLERALDTQQCQAVIAAIADFLEIDIADPTQWYNSTNRNGIMVELTHHAALIAARNSKRIHKAFSQLWETDDLIVSADRCGFNPPHTELHPFSGPDLHWDVDFTKPLNFGTQGIVYLTDTEAQQGALTLVPGFHHQLQSRVDEFKHQQHEVDLHKLGSKPIPAKAGDMVIWHQFLPHGSRANLTDKPRIVQYINMYPFPKGIE